MPASKWFVNFVGTHRMWYTKVSKTEPDLTEFDSAPFTSSQLKNVEAVS
jgi:hypothetical protein